MNLPNKITMLRVIMIPFFAFFMLTDVVGNSKYIAVAIFIIASLTDTLDGFIASIFIYAAVALTVISLVDYLIKNWKVLDDGKM